MPIGHMGRIRPYNCYSPITFSTFTVAGTSGDHVTSQPPPSDAPYLFYRS
jgi:hypothetical protein